MDKLMITIDQATSLLNDSDNIHTFRNGGGMLIGADHDRTKLIEKMKKYSDTLQIGGEMCKAMKHALILEDESGYLFIECNMDKVKEIDPEPNSFEKN